MAKSSSQAYGFMKFNSGKNVAINAGIIVLFLLVVSHVMGKKRACSCDKNSTAAVNGNSTISDSRKYVAPADAQDQVVVRKSIGWYTSRAQ